MKNLSTHSAIFYTRSPAQFEMMYDAQMLIKSSLMILLVSLLCCFNASADDSILDREQKHELESDGLIRVDEKFRLAVNTALKGWISNPIKNDKRSTKISWVDLNLLLSEIDQVSVYINPTNRAIIGSGNRIGGVYFNEEKKVIINLSLLNILTGASTRTAMSLIGSEVLLIHEFLGALGYPDENYEISSHLYMRSAHWDYGNNLIEASEKMLVNHLEKNSKRLENISFDGELKVGPLALAGNGSSTGVGGGGDPASAAIKMLLFSMLGRYENYYKGALKTEVNYLKLVDQLVKLKIEPAQENQTYEKNPQSLFVEIKGTDEALVLTIPTSIVFHLKHPQEFLRFGHQIINYLLDIMQI